MIQKSIGKSLLLAMAIFVLTPPAIFAKTLVDMAGRTVTVPEKILKVYGSSPPATNLLYAIDPERIAGLNFPSSDAEKKFMNQRLLSLPVVGGWFGQGQTPNMETLLAVRPDLILVWQYKQSVRNADIERLLAPLNAPIVFVVLDHLEDYPAVFRFMGRLLGEEKRTEALAKYAEKSLSDLKTLTSGIPEKDRVTVYYAENEDGLSTECDRSIHAELIPLCGGVNPHQCVERDGYGMEKLSLEQVLLYNPQVIVTHSSHFYTDAFSDKRWRKIRAVRDKRIYLIPKAPMNWFDRPPSFMRLLGARWLAHSLYPKQYPVNVDEETRRFYSLFLGHDLTGTELRELFQP